MKFTADSKTFASALTTVSRAAKSRSVQVLNGILLKAQGNELTLTATDMDLTISLVIPANVTEQDECLVPATALKAAMKGLKDEITCATNKDVFTVAQGHRTLRVPLYELTDYPKLPAEAYASLPKGDPGAVTIATADFLAVWQSVGLSYSRDESRPVLTGIKFDASPDGTVTLVSTDSYRLSVDSCPATVPDEQAFIIPGRTMAEAVRLLKGKGGPETFQVKRGSDEHRVAITVGTTVIHSRVIEGQFPNWKQLIPDATPEKIVFHREQLLDVTQSAAAAAVRNAPVRLTITQEEVTFRVFSEGVTILEIPLNAEITLDERNFKNGMEIGFNGDFLADGAASAAGDEVTLSLINPLRPGIITSDARPGFTYLIMPIRLAG